MAWLVRNLTLLNVVEGAKCEGDGVNIIDLNPNEFRQCPKGQAWISPLTRISADTERDGGENDSDSA